MTGGWWLYAWLGLAQDGQMHKGEAMGRSKNAVRRDLIHRDLQPLSVRTTGYLPSCYWRRRQLIELISQLASLLGAGLTLRDGLALLAEGHPRAGWRCLLRLLLGQLEQGLSLSQACAGFPHVFPPLYCAMMALGELTGRLDRCCQQWAEHEGRLEQLTQRITAALRYPALVCLTAAAVTGLMLALVLPEFARLYASLDAPLPAATRILMSLSEVAIAGGAPALAGLLLIYGCWKHICRRRPDWEQAVALAQLYVPGVGALLRHHNLFLLFQTLAMTYRAGVTLDEGLEIAARALPHPGYRRAARDLQHHLRRGFSLHQGIRRHALFPVYSHQLIKTAEYAGTLDDALPQLALLHEQRAQRQAEALAKLAEPVLLFAVGGVVCALAMVLYLPLLQLGDLFGHF